jgi:hypothetical protein
MSPTPVIIKLHPKPEEYVEAETAFLRAVGLCITQWAFVDRQLIVLSQKVAVRLALESVSWRDSPA